MRRLASLSLVAVCAATPVHAGEVLELERIVGPGAFEIDPEEGITAPGIAAYATDLDNDDDVSPNGKSLREIENCLVSTAVSGCDAGPGAGNRSKLLLRGDGPIDLVFGTAESGSVAEYNVRTNLRNRRGARLEGFHVQIGTGVGEDFTPATGLEGVEGFDMDYALVPREDEAADWAGAREELGQDPVQRAFFPGGLFGGSKANASEGFFSASGIRSGFFFDPRDAATLSAAGVFGPYEALFGDGLLPLAYAPEGILWDNDGDPDTDAVVVAYFDGRSWRGVSDPQEVVTPGERTLVELDEEQIQAWLADPAFEAGAIEDLASVNVNFNFDLPDLAGEQLTIRVVPVYDLLADVARTEAQAAMAERMDSLRNPVSGADADLVDAIREIDALDAPARRRALERAGLSFLAGARDGAFSIADGAISSVERRLRRLRAGADGAEAVDGGRESVATAAVTASEADEVLAGVASLVDTTGADGASVPLGGGMSAFLAGSFEVSDLDATENQIGSDRSVAALALGIDRRLGARSLAGAALGLSALEADFDDGRGSMDILSPTLMAYGAAEFGAGGHFDAVAALGYLDYEHERRIVFGGVDETARAQSQGRQLGIAARGGWDFRLGGLQMGPVARLQALRAWLDGYAESGAGGLGLQVEDQTATSVIAGLGLRAGWQASGSWGKIAPSAAILFEREFADGADRVETAFAGAGGGGFITPIDAPERNRARLELGLSARLSGWASLEASYEATLFNDEMSRHRGMMSVMLRF